MSNTSDSRAIGWVRRFLPFCLLTLLPFLASCSEADDTVEEYANWEQKNEEAFLNIYNQALASSDGQWKVIRAYTKADTYNGAIDPYDYIVVEVRETGAGTVSPCLTDSVSIHYKGWLLPSYSYSKGYSFDGSYDGEYNKATSHPVNDVTPGGFIKGFATALQHMHVGDYWRVYIPYTLAYGESGTSGIPGYSMLIFDLRLQDIWN